jgi:head-tail adaptor
MNPGTLDRKIFIQRQAPGLFMVTANGDYMTLADGVTRMTTSSRRGRFGAERDAWGLWKTRWAAKKDLRGDESASSGREIGRQEVRFRIRYTAGLKLTDRIQHDGLAYDIVDIREIGRRELQDVFCVLHSNLRAEGQDAE